MTALMTELVRLAHVAAASPAQRAEVATGLRMALAIVEPTSLTAASMVAQLEDIAGGMIVLADRAEWLAEAARALMTQPPQTGPQLG